MRRILHAGLLFLFLSALALPARADPLLMFLFNIAREMVTNAVERERAARPVLPDPPPELYVGTAVQPAHLRALIDDSFSYLSGAQRDEVFQSLHAQLIKPKNAAVRAPLIQYFAERAMQVREARARMARLSPEEMARMAAEFGRRIRDITDDERLQLREVLRRGLLPVPDALGEMMIAALGPERAPIEPLSSVTWVGTPVATLQ